MASDQDVMLPADLESYVTSLVASGRFRDRSAAIAEAVSKMREHESEIERAKAVLREEIQVGYEQAQRGETEDAAVVFARLRQKFGIPSSEE